MKSKWQIVDRGGKSVGEFAGRTPLNAFIAMCREWGYSKRFVWIGGGGLRYASDQIREWVDFKGGGWVIQPVEGTKCHHGLYGVCVSCADEGGLATPNRSRSGPSREVEQIYH